jgi:quercetin dioxygenase-like cupin family protein
MTHDTSKAQALKPVAVPKDEGEARWWFGSLAVIKATAADTGGLLTVVEVTEAPGAEAPLHVHHRDDEAFWVLEGDVTFQVGDATIEAHAGDYVFAPRDIPHRFTVGDAGCRMLFIMVPGGLEGVLRATSQPAPSLTLPPPPEEEPDVEAIKAIVAAHGYELLI